MQRVSQTRMNHRRLSASHIKRRRRSEIPHYPARLAQEKSVIACNTDRYTCDALLLQIIQDTTVRVVKGRFIMTVVVLILLVVAQMEAVALRNDGNTTCPSQCFCSKTFTSVNCSGKKLTAIPDGMPPQVETLYLDNNLLTSLIAGALSNLTHLTTIFLRNNKLREIAPFAFLNLPQLGEIYLTNNYIASLPVDVFAQTGPVKYLNLGANDLTSVPDLRHLPQLQTLVLDANKITDATFPPMSTNLAVLNSVVLSNNKILQLTNDTFEALRNSSVRKLEISRNGLTNVSSGALKPLVALQSLKIGYNPLDGVQLQHVLEGLREDKNLQSLDIRSIQLDGTLPSLSFSILSGTPLSTLIFKNNKVRKIPPNAFAHLPKLKQLELAACQIQHVASDAFADLPSLQLLFLNDNQDLDDVPDNLPASLLRLYLQGNSISMLKGGKFTNLTVLQELYLSNNKMDHWLEDSFLGLQNLRILHLNNNMLSYIPKPLFAPLTRLNTLSLKNNNFKNLKPNPGVMSSLVALTTLDMSSNQCSYLPEEYLNELASLQNLNLDNNDLKGLFATDDKGALLGNLRKLQRLSLASNNLVYIHDAQFRNLFELKNLTLRNNQLSSWGPNLFHTAARSLDSLDLSFNQVALVNETSVKDLAHIRFLNLSMNPFACTCDLLWFCDWLNKTTIQILDLHHYKCNSPSEWNGKPLLTFCAAHIDCTDYTWYYVGGASGATFISVVLIATCMYRQRWFLLLRIYRIQKQIRRCCGCGIPGRIGYDPVPGNDNIYDFYIIASEDDNEWVREELLPKLDRAAADEVQAEADNKFRLYFEERDAIPGKMRIENFEDTMPACRAVLVVLTGNLKGDAWCEFLLKQAEELRVTEEIESIQIVKVGNVSPADVPKVLRRAMQNRNFFEFPNRDRVEQEFAERLRDVLQQGQGDHARHVQHV